jgi:hypothetical protein
MMKKKRKMCLRMAPFAKAIRRERDVTNGTRSFCVMFCPFISFYFLIFISARLFVALTIVLQQVGQQKLMNATPES